MPDVTADDASFVDEDGRHVIVKLTPDANRDVRTFADVFDPDGDDPLTIAIIDNSLSAGGEGYDDTEFYYRKLERKLLAAYPDAAVDIQRYAWQRDQLGYFPVRRMVSAAAKVYAADPDVIVISCDQQDLFNFTPSEVLARYFALMIHNYIANTRAKIVLVTPPPRPERAARCKVFATAISKVALTHRVGLADVYQAVNLYEGDWETLFLDEVNSDGVYYLYMNSKGQEIAAETIFNAIVKE